MSRKCISCGGEPTSEHASWFCQPCISVLSSNTSETDANRQLSETPRKVRPNRRVEDADRRPLWIALVVVATLVALWWAG